MALKVQDENSITGSSLSISRQNNSYRIIQDEFYLLESMY